MLCVTVTLVLCLVWCCVAQGSAPCPIGVESAISDGNAMGAHLDASNITECVSAQCGVRGVNGPRHSAGRNGIGVQRAEVGVPHIEKTRGRCREIEAERIPTRRCEHAGRLSLCVTYPDSRSTTMGTAISYRIAPVAEVMARTLTARC